MFVAAYIQQFKVDASAFLAKKKSIHIAALLWMRLVLLVGLEVARNLMIEMGSLGLKKCSFICNLAFFTIIAMKLDTVSTYSSGRFACQQVR